MSDYIDTFEGWRERTIDEPYPSHTPRLVEYDENNRTTRVWVREAPVPPLPSAPYTVIRVTWKPLDAMRTYEFVLLDGSWRNKHGEVLDPDGVASFEVLSEPRAITAKAVLDHIGSEPWARDTDLSHWRRVFGVES